MPQTRTEFILNAGADVTFAQAGLVNRKGLEILVQQLVLVEL
ncbi:MAG: hypothetical protein PVG71_06660 [Anaerolineae bacterium]